MYGEWKIFKKFPQDLKEVEGLKLKSTGKPNKILCSFYSQGFYKAGPGCMFDHPDVDCRTYIRVENVTNNR